MYVKGSFHGNAIVLRMLFKVCNILQRVRSGEIKLF